MKIEVQNATHHQLNAAIDRCEGRFRDKPEPRRATDADLEGRTVPYTLYSVWDIVEEVTVLRYGINTHIGATAPSLTIQYNETGDKALASAGMFYLTREEAEYAAMLENWGEPIDFMTDIAEGARRIDEARIGTWFDMEADQWCATPCPPPSHSLDNAKITKADSPVRAYTGATRQEAGLRCYLALRMGNEIDVDDDTLDAEMGTGLSPTP